jgi:hypothetical protein
MLEPCTSEFIVVYSYRVEVTHLSSTRTGKTAGRRTMRIHFNVLHSKRARHF